MDDEISAVHERLNKLGQRVTKLETKQPMIEELMERSVASNEKLSETMHEVQTTMALMNNKMDSQAEATEKHFANIDERMKSIEDKGNFDIYSYIKAKWPWVILAIGAIAAVASKYVKF